METQKCFSCGGIYPQVEGPTHRYMLSSPGCWAIYGEVLAREYSDWTYNEVHRLTVDAYAIQHPGGCDRQSIQSVGLHLIRLGLFLEHDLSPERANDAMVEAAKTKELLTHLEPPPSVGAITAADIYKVTSGDEHKRLVLDWANSVWQAWSMHHDQIRSWLSMSPKLQKFV